jgi:hypothetical protein
MAASWTSFRAAGTYDRIAADLADALDDGYNLRVLSIIGKGSVRKSE